MSTANEAIGSIDAAHWGNVQPAERLAILQHIQSDLAKFTDTLGEAEASMKNIRMGEALQDPDTCKLTTVIPIANNITAAIQLYESILHGHDRFQPTTITPVKGTTSSTIQLYDIAVSPLTWKETVFNGTRRDRLRVRGTPNRKGPYDKTPRTIAVLGAGNYSSAVEVIKAIFYDNCAVAHKPHPLNADMDKIWARIFDPLVKAKALAFCAADQGPAMTTDPRIDTIYFTGGAPTAHSIMQTTKTPMICESGGVNPTLIVPGERLWTPFELKHHAQQIVSLAKLNGGHVCARQQLIVTCQHWSQRDAFLEQVEAAIQSTTYACGSYYPGATQVFDRFAKQYPHAKRIAPEGSQYKRGDVLWVAGDTEDGFACRTEAFCQVLTEVPLDTKATARDFLPYATQFCNEKVVGSLCAAIVIDGTTRKHDASALEQAVTDLQYGSIGINLLPAHVFSSPYLIWGGNEEGKPLVSGNGHFGNVFGYENVEKSIIDDAFVSPNQLKLTCKAAMSNTIAGLAVYSVYPTWYNLFVFLFKAITGLMRGKDW